MEEGLRKAGYRVVPFERGAEVANINTCTVTAATDAQSRNLVRRARRINPACQVVVTGCYAQVNPQALLAIPGVFLVLGNNEKKDLLRFLEGGKEVPAVSVSNIRQSREVSLTLSSFPGRSRAFLQIQNGCDAFCSYCIIPYARGPSRSVPKEQVMEQAERLVADGFSEIVLTGIHIGVYGVDLQPPLSLLDLVQAIEAQVDIKRLRLGSLEPTEIPEALIELVACSEVICPHFHIPLQAGDDAVLKRMNRHYNTSFFQDLIKRIRDRIPDAAIGLDVIAGFPGETEREFSNTFHLIESLPITHLHVFPFSRRPGTLAATMEGQVPGNLVRERAARLRTTGREKNRAFAQRFVGQVLEVVVEGEKVNGSYKGLSRNYLAILFAGEDGLEGKRINVQVTEWTPVGLRGKIAGN
jgi:threonylcarbamoyladenosine tRNA methylthiotransferase MtaB